MPAVSPAPFVPYRAFDDDADPLAGGALYAFAAGTDTPLETYADPQGLTLNPHPVVLDDAGYAHVYLQAGVPYKLVQTDSAGVQQWTVDQVFGGGGGGSSAAGVGWGKNTVEVQPASGSAQAVAAVFPGHVLALAVTVWVETTLGTSQGLESVGIGTLGLPDCWGHLPALTADTETTAGLFQGYSAQPQPVNGQVTLTAYGGRFDGAGTVYVTGHWATFTPGHEVGYSYTPGVPTDGELIPPQPYASETTPGLVELADAAEVLTDADLTHPLTIGRLIARTATDTRVGLVELADSAEVLADTDTTRALTIGRLVTRTATETRVGLAELATSAETTTGTDTTRAVHPAGVKAALDARHTGTALSVARFATGGTSLETSPLSVDASGNLRFGSAVAGASLTSGLVVSSGTPPTASHPADAIQLWVADLDGVAGQAALHVRSENGILSRIGTGLMARRYVQILATQTVAAPYAAVADESGKVFVANNTSQVQLTLPLASAGLIFECIANHLSGFRIRTSGTNVIRLGSTLSAAGGAIEVTGAGNVGHYLTLVAINTSIWQVMSPPQSWALIA